MMLDRECRGKICPDALIGNTSHDLERMPYGDFYMNACSKIKIGGNFFVQIPRDAGPPRPPQEALSCPRGSDFLVQEVGTPAK